MIRGIRGATTVKANEAELVFEATKELLTEIVRRNEIELDQIASAFFTVTKDLDAVSPAAAARSIGWQLVPLFCAQEPVMRGSLPRCIRTLILFETDRSPGEIRHVYLREAASLRPDLLEV